MGQYFYTVNVDKREFIHPHRIGAGLKMGEFSSSSTWAHGMALLLSSGHGDTEISGRWAGDRIVVAGDYAADDIPPDLAEKLAADGVEYTGNTLHALANQVFTDISEDVGRAVLAWE